MRAAFQMRAARAQGPTLPSFARRSCAPRADCACYQGSMRMHRLGALSLVVAIACNAKQDAAPDPSRAAQAPSATPSASARDVIRAPLTPPAPPSLARDVAARVAGDIVVGGGASKYLRELSDVVGGRVTGSPGYVASVKWAGDALRAAGVPTVRTEPFTMEKSWTRGEARARIVAPDRKLHVAATGWTPGAATPIRAEVAVLDDFSPKAVRANAARLAGKIVLLDLSKLKRGGFLPFLRAIEPLRDAKIAALLLAGRKPNNLLGAHTVPNGAHVDAPFAIGDLGREDALFVQRLAEKGPVTIEYQDASVLGGEQKVDNVIAEIPGREKPNEWVMIGAHLDSWDYATGSQDNGAGVAQVLEVARAVRAAGFVPRRSIRFALWGGEEQGLFGSRAWVKEHDKDLDDVVALLNTDNGSGVLHGWHLGGRDDLRAPTKAIGGSLLTGLGGDDVDDAVECDTDHCPFMLAGVPTFNLWVDMDKYMEVHHVESDTFDKIHAGSLSMGAATIALTALEIAERPERVAPRLGRPAVAAIVKKAGLEEDLVFEGLWKK